MQKDYDLARREIYRRLTKEKEARDALSAKGAENG